MKSWVEISTERLAANLRAVQAVAGSEVEVLAVVKANGYGHDAVLSAQALVAAGAKWLGVSDVDEGARVREALGESDTRLLVMCGMEAEDADAILEHNLTPVVWTAEQVSALERVSRVGGKRISVHLEIETGMARQGAASGEELTRVLERITESPRITCEGVMSHLCCSEIAGSLVTASQLARFAEALAQIAGAGIQPEVLHLGNSSAIDEASTTAWVQEAAAKLGARVMVRPGIAIYGDCLAMEGGATPKLHPALQPVLTWKTRVTGVREIAAGMSVGYGATFVASQPMRLALLPVGYADGFRREASSGIGNGWVVITGKKAPVVGRVSMNLTVVDVSAIEEASVGAEVTLLGKGVTADDHAQWCRTIPYDILCGIRAKFLAR